MEWKSMAEEMLPLMREWRRHIHQYPEIGFQEIRTSTYIANIMENMGLEVYKGISGTGVIGVLHGEKLGKVVGIRSELDALPIEEINDVPYKSKCPGVMHACGHDGHMALTLGTAYLLSRHRNLLKGTVLFIFQPAEELLPSGGAQSLYREGQKLLKDMDCIFACHLWPSLYVGEIHVPNGLIMAAGDTFHINIIGKSGHASAPHYAKDSIMAAAHTLLGINQIVSRQVNPHEAIVISVSSINGGSGINILPDKVQMAGTTRYYGKELQPYLSSTMKQVISGITSAYGCDYEFEYNKGYDATINTPECAELVRNVAVKQLGKENVHSNLLPALTSEDFSYYLQHVPGCYFWVGCKNNNIQKSLHSALFDFDERAMAVGAAIMADTAWSVINLDLI